MRNYTWILEELKGIEKNVTGNTGLDTVIRKKIGELKKRVIKHEPWILVNPEKDNGNVSDYGCMNLPEHNLGVLIFIENEDISTTGMWDIDNKWCTIDEYRVIEFEQVTHWMPLPENPKTP